MCGSRGADLRLFTWLPVRPDQGVGLTPRRPLPKDYTTFPKRTTAWGWADHPEKTPRVGMMAPSVKSLWYKYEVLSSHPQHSHAALVEAGWACWPSPARELHIQWETLSPTTKWEVIEDASNELGHSYSHAYS